LWVIPNEAGMLLSGNKRCFAGENPNFI
jgi:hypothetical protein